MKYLIAVKPCGCVGSWISNPNHPGRLEDFRALYEREGAIVRESESPPPFIFRKDCTHGSLPAQLAAKVREAEAREAELRNWLRKRIADRKKEASFYSDAEMGSPAYDLLLGVGSLMAVYEEVLAKLDETAPPAERRMQYRESPAPPYVQAEIDRGLKLGKKAAEISERKKGGCEPQQ